MTELNRLKQGVQRISLWGGPGCGKSTTAALVFATIKDATTRLSWMHQRWELVQEVAKEWAWRDQPIKGFDQLDVFNAQLQRERRLLDENVRIVSDCSPLLCAYYAKAHRTPGHEAVMDIALEYESLSDPKDALHVMLRRDPARPYVEHGRFESAQQAMTRDVEIDNFLEMHVTHLKVMRLTSAELIELVRAWTSGEGGE